MEVKDIAPALLGEGVDVAKKAKGEAKKIVEGLKRTARYIKYWAGISLAVLATGTWIWSGGDESVVRGMIGGSWLFSNIMLGVIIWNAAFAAGMVALATTAGDELFGARFPNVEPATVIDWAKKAAGVVAWVEFLHLAAYLLPVSAWANPALTGSAFMAATIVLLLALSGSLSGPWGKRLMIATAMIVLLVFVGRNIPGVSEYAGSTTTDTIRKLKRLSAEKDLKGLPEDLIGRKMSELADLQKAAIGKCGKFACTDDDRAKTAELEKDIASLQASGTPVPGEAEDSSGMASAEPAGSYYEHALPPVPPSE